MSGPTPICFAGYEPGRPVIPLALACGLGGPHAYGHRRNAIARLCREAPALWRATPLEEAAVVVYPHRYEDDAATRAVAEAARRAGLPCLFFEHGDIENPSLPPYGTVYRTALDARRLADRETAMSGLSDDLWEEARGEAETSDRPTVGFCGNTGSFRETLRESLRGRWHVLAASRLRRRALDLLEADPRIGTRFLRRDRYWGGTVQASGGRVALADENRAENLRREFADTILDTVYTLCVRGAGNYSIRFYEVLSAGRIPLLIDTHCVLPFEDEIDWKRHCLRVPSSELRTLGDILVEFHRELGVDGCRAMGMSNRRLWEERLEATAFYRTVVSNVLRGEADPRS